jgi:hypothetical protein
LKYDKQPSTTNYVRAWRHLICRPGQYLCEAQDAGGNQDHWTHGAVAVTCPNCCALICDNCGEFKEQHVDGKCLFVPTKFRGGP